MTPPPATISGRRAARTSSAARATASGAGGRRQIVHTRDSMNDSGTSKASVWRSSGSASVTAPVSAGSLSTRMASSAEGTSCSGRSMRSK
jgi:hypothetical protein